MLSAIRFASLIFLVLPMKSRSLRRDSRHQTPRAQHVSWSCQELEPRLLLAADAGVAVVQAAAGADIAAAADNASREESSAPASRQQSTNEIVFVDPGLENVEEILQSIPGDHELILMDAKRPGLAQISQVIRQRSGITAVHILSHGGDGKLQLGGGIVDHQALHQHADELRQWANALTDDADVLLYGCDVAAGESGRSFMRQFASITGADIAASTNKTGNDHAGADWILERSVGTIEHTLVVSDQLRHHYNGTMALSFSAAGTTGEEQVLLQIDGQTVATYQTLGDGAYGGVFETFTYDADGLSADQIRFVFTNDLYDPDLGIDRNVRIDSITIDGTTFQSESPDVFSTGTWLPSDGITPGFRESEFLHGNGYMQFADSAGTSGSLINIRAAGSMGEETMQLLIDETVVETWENVGTQFSDFVYRAADAVSADQIRVSFGNDVYDPDAGIDRNLIVDQISIDGVIYETEAPNVFSTGTWRPEDGISPGFRESEMLHGNGYFQFDAPPPAQHGSIGLTLDALTIDEDLGILNAVVFREGGADGTVTVDYQTVAGTADDQDFTPISGTLVFEDGVTGQQLAIEILDDTAVENIEEFSLVLS
ncbi:MAG: DUF4347 domain-containing protein, partial [Planctomycetota bacterium]